MGMVNYTHTNTYFLKGNSAATLLPCQTNFSLFLQENVARREAEAKRIKREKLQAEEKEKREAAKKRKEKLVIERERSVEVVDQLLARMKEGNMSRRRLSAAQSEVVTHSAKVAAKMWRGKSSALQVVRMSGRERRRSADWAALESQLRRSN